MKRLGLKLTDFSLHHPKWVIGIVTGITVLFILGAALPSLFPKTFSGLSAVQVDTDPENMLSKDEAVRVFHDQMKEVFSLRDMVVVGIVNEENADGVFNVDSLRRIYELTEFSRTLRWTGKDGDEEGVVEIDLIAPSTVDNIEQGGPGVVRFEWLMPEPPDTAAEAIAVREKARRLPFLNGTLISEDGKAICLYLPLTDKHLSYKVYSELREKIAGFSGDDRFFITGLPVAEDTFGVEMFIQMAVSAPLAMLVIFLLMLYFFRKLSLIASPLIIAFIAVSWTMGLLIITGNTIHIMSSMIPIFIMPIAVLDAIHIISMFFDRYQQTRNRVETMRHVMDSLFMAMLYTSLTSAAGFASLALTPIPPVQVFGMFAAFGIMVAWLLTITFIPAFIAMIPDEKLKTFGAGAKEGDPHHGRLAAILHGISQFTYRRAWAIVIGAAAVMVMAAVGISLIQINDNPIRWFSKSHPIRVADRVLNDHFGGTYMAYLAFEPEAGSSAEKAPGFPAGFANRLKQRQDEMADPETGIPQAKEVLSQVARQMESDASSLKNLFNWAQTMSQKAPEAEWEAWDEAILFLEQEDLRKEIFKNPDVLRYLGTLQEALNQSGLVGKSNGLTDIVKTVHRELFEGRPEYLRIPDTQAAVAQCLLTYQNSHRPHDLWHFATQDYRKTNLWLQLRTGDNKDMSRIIQFVDQYMSNNPPPLPIKHQWFGLTYINVVWQQKMVSGMLHALLGSFLVVFILMTILFRSAIWGFLAMIPLSITIVFTYGAIGFIGKDYDMPVAVLSSLSLGLAVDFAIHFLEHSRIQRGKHGNWEAGVAGVFGEPARAIWRNIIVIAVGFTPLLFAPLIPYKTVGVLMAAILVVAGVATLLILPALVKLLEKQLFPESKACCLACNCITCTITSAAIIGLIVISTYHWLNVGWSLLTITSLGAVLLLAGLCRRVSNLEKCQRERAKQKGGQL